MPAVRCGVAGLLAGSVVLRGVSAGLMRGCGVITLCGCTVNGRWLRWLKGTGAIQDYGGVQRGRNVDQSACVWRRFSSSRHLALDKHFPIIMRMLKEETVFILGAGASMPYGFPSGEKLIREIQVECEKIRNGDFSAIAGTGFSTKGFPELARLIDNTNFRSIDVLLERYSEYIQIGKLLIAISLLPKENKVIPFSAEYRPENWMLYLCEKMEGARLEDFASNPVTFITFNYDRSLEYFLRRHCMDRYRDAEKTVIEQIAKIRIIHVHGQLGDLSEVPYGSFERKYNGNVAVKAAAGIHIIHEADAESADFKQACDSLRNASKVGILGFGYLATNMDRLKFEETLRGRRRVFGTSLGMTKPELMDVRDRIFRSPPGQFYDPFMDGTCMHLLRNSELLF